MGHTFGSEPYHVGLVGSLFCKEEERTARRLKGKERRKRGGRGELELGAASTTTIPIRKINNQELLYAINDLHR
jgi:hypothetical protein